MPHKYGAKPTHVDGIRFASKAEAKRYGELKLLERAKQISGLTCHPRFGLVVNGQLVGHYAGDFGYIEGKKVVCEDVKSTPTKTEAYRLRVKVFRACHPDIDFREIGK